MGSSVKVQLFSVVLVGGVRFIKLISFQMCSFLMKQILTFVVSTYGARHP